MVLRRIDYKDLQTVRTHVRSKKVSGKIVSTSFGNYHQGYLENNDELRETFWRLWG